MALSRLNYLGGNEDWEKFTTQVSKNTGSHYHEMWYENARANRKLIKKYGWAAEELQDAHKGKTAVLLGASPAINKQIERLKTLQRNSDFVFIGITSGLKNVLSQGIKPRYCMIADADPAIKRFWKGLDMSLTKEITLISNVCTHPDLLKMWQGDIKFVAIYTDIKKMERKFKKWFKDMNGCGGFFPALSSQYNTGAAFSLLVFGCEVLIFVGNELSFPSNDCEKDRYYPDKKDIKDSWARSPHIDIYGKKVYTNFMLMSLKLSLEDFLGKVSGAGWFLNATEAGIFGVSKRYGNLPWVHQLPLETAIAQAKHIMQYGEPLTVRLHTPTISETEQYGIQ